MIRRLQCVVIWGVVMRWIRSDKEVAERSDWERSFVWEARCDKEAAGRSD